MSVAVARRILGRLLDSSQTRRGQDKSDWTRERYVRGTAGADVVNFSGRRPKPCDHPMASLMTGVCSRRVDRCRINGVYRGEACSDLQRLGQCVAAGRGRVSCAYSDNQRHQEDNHQTHDSVVHACNARVALVLNTNLTTLCLTSGYLSFIFSRLLANPDFLKNARFRVLAPQAARGFMIMLPRFGDDMFRRQFLASTAAGFTLLAANHVLAQENTAGVKPDLMQPGPLPEWILGRDDAPVTVIEYASMTCGHCANFHLNVWPAFKAEFIDTGKVRFILREFPFDPRATAAFMLSRCMGDDKWYPTVDLLFRNQQRWARAQDGKQGFLSVLSMTGLKEADLEACLSDQVLLDKVNAVAARGQELGVDSTPTFFINGEKYTGVMPIEQLRSIIEPLVAGAGK